jgi:hypothetical protein
MKVISPERALVLAPVSDSDKYEALSVQLETVRLNGVSAIGLIKSLIDTVNKLCYDVAQLKSDKSEFLIQLEGLQTSRQQPPSLLSPRPAANSGNSSSSGPLALATCNDIPTQGAASSKSGISLELNPTETSCQQACTVLKFLQR